MDKIVDAPTFLDSEVWDKDLPVARPDGQGNELISRGESSTGGISIPKTWNDAAIDTFMLYQPYVQSPFFDLESHNDVPFHELDDDVTLPFTEDHYNQRRQHGHHGTVWRVKIHRAHHNFRPPPVCEPVPYLPLIYVSNLLSL
jgi:hypothetical protein